MGLSIFVWKVGTRLFPGFLTSLKLLKALFLQKSSEKLVDRGSLFGSALWSLVTGGPFFCFFEISLEKVVGAWLYHALTIYSLPTEVVNVR